MCEQKVAQVEQEQVEGDLLQELEVVEREVEEMAELRLKGRHMQEFDCSRGFHHYPLRQEDYRP